MARSSKAVTPTQYIASLKEPRKSEIKKIHKVIRTTAPGLKPKMFGNYIGYGSYKYKTRSGIEGEWFVLGLASNKTCITVAACAAVDGKCIAEVYKPKLPEADIGKSCIRIKKWDDVDERVMKDIFRKSAKLASSM